MKKFDLGWGESVAVRCAFPIDNYIVFGRYELMRLGYPAHEGDKRLITLTRKVIERQIGINYKYILITNGATGAATIAMRMYANDFNFNYCITREPPYFRLYPSMSQSAGLIHITQSNKYHTLPSDVMHPAHAIYLLDSLSNPLGTFPQLDVQNPVIWDAVYFGRVYAPGIHPIPNHRIMIGSYSKLTGLNGLRIGWIATNDLEYYERLKKYVTAEYYGISAASTYIVMETIGKWTEEDWKEFEGRANMYLDDNRTEFSKLEKFFGGKEVSKYGMFYYAPIDKTCKKLLEKSGIIWSPGSQLGTSDNFGRFNVGQDMSLVKEAVKTILKNDRC